MIVYAKSHHSPTMYHLKEAEMKIMYVCPFFNHKSLYGFGGHCLKIRDVCMDFEPCFKVFNLVSVHPRSIKLGEMTTLKVIFHVGVSLSIGYHLQLAPVPCAISEWPIEIKNLIKNLLNLQVNCH